MPFRFGAAAILASIALLLPSPGFVSWGQESGDLKAFRELQGELRQRMDDDLQEAIQFLESQIAQSPDSADLNVLRHSLASRLIRQRDYQAANTQFQKLLDFQIKHVDQTEHQYGIWMTVQSIREVASISASSEALRAAVDRAFEALKRTGRDDQHQTQLPLSQVAVLKAQFMIEDGEVDQAKALVQEHLNSLVDINDSQRASQETMRSLIRMLRLLTTSDRANDSWRDEYISQLDEVVSAAFDRYPNSIPLQTDYAETQLLMITRWRQDDPEATKQRIEKVTGKLALIATRNRSVQATLRRIEIHKERMAAVKSISSLVGQPAPKWDVDAWVIAKETTQDSLKGKVILLDFWAMWCDPCIATFPRLRQWREEFGDDGFEVVGVTQYYNFAWDEEAERATRSSDEVSPKEERETLASFLKHHQLDHPVFVTPTHSKMQSEFGVRGIPHVVLVDRDGIVQLVKTGADPSTADEIYAKIKELLGAKTKQ